MFFLSRSRTTRTNAGARLGVETLEDRCVPATNLFAVGADAGFTPMVKVYDATTRQEVFSFLAYNEGFRGGVRVAVGDYDGDGNQDIITGAGPGAGPHVKVFDGLTLALQTEFYAYDAGFTGGVTVAAGNFNQFDGRGPRTGIITGAGPGAGPHVKVFDYAGREYASFYAFDQGFQGGVSVAAGNTTGRASDSVIVGAGPGAPGGHVKVFGPTLVLGPPRPTGGLNYITQPFTELQSFFAFPGFTGGVTVAATYFDDTGRADILVGAGPGAPGGHVKVFNDSDNAEVFSFLPFPTAFTGGVRLASADINNDSRKDILIGSGASPLAVPQVLVFDTDTRTPSASFVPFGASYLGGVFVGSATSS